MISTILGFLVSFAIAQPGVIDGNKVRHTDTKTNYIVNTDAEKNLRGVGANPDDINYTAPTRTTTSGEVIEGDASFKITYQAITCALDAFLCRGEAIFDLKPRSDFVKAQTCEASFKYEKLSGTGATNSSTFGIKFYDVSNNVLYWHSAKGGETEEKGTIRSYYPCENVAKIGVVGSAITMSVDDVYFGLASNGGVAGGVKARSFTPVITHSSGSMTNATTTGWYSCSNNVATVSTMTTFSGSVGTWSSYYVSMPSGLTIDTTKFTASANQVLGNTIFRDAGVANYNGPVRYSSVGSAPEVTYEAVSAAPGNVQYGSITNSAPFSFGSGDGINTTFTVPVTNCPESTYWDYEVPSDFGTYTFTFGAACPAGSIPADGTNGTVDMRGLFPRGHGTQSVGGISYDGGTVGTKYNDRIQGHRHYAAATSGYKAYGGGSGGWAAGAGFMEDLSVIVGSNPITDGTNGTPRTGSDTRPVNVAVRWCMKNATVSAPRVLNSVIASSDVKTVASDGYLTVASGTYTPTVVAGTNISAVGTSVCQYMRVGNIVNVSCRSTMTCATASNTESSFEVPLPISSTLSTGSELNGTSNGAGALEQGLVAGNSGTNRVNVTFRCNTTNSLSGRRYIFQYSIQ